tara:strand:+ start:202 stop:840 length:639 start_codon:yes stop_codon:yes gene_type:complete
MSTRTIEKMSKELTSFHPYVLVPFDRTSMTVPQILFSSISVKIGDPKPYFKKLSSRVKSDILNLKVQPTNLQGKLSGKIQDFAWCEIVGTMSPEDIALDDFKEAKVIPYEDKIFCANTTMTIPMFLFNLIQSNLGGTSRDTTKYIRQIASDLKEKIFLQYAEERGFKSRDSLTEDDLNVLAYELKGKISHKIQENLWLQFIPDDIKHAPLGA